MDNLDSMFGSDDEDEQNENEMTNRPESCGVLKFHNGTEDALYHYVVGKAAQGDVSAILKTIDEFCYTQHWMMHIGDQKLQHLRSSLDTARENSPSHLCVAELGSYCGYSAIYLGSLLDKSKGDHLFCIEADPKCVGWTRRMITHANLQDVVTVVATPASEVDTWRSELSKDHIDVLFIDHDKSQYLNDLLRIEQAGLLKTGSVVVADNVLSFGIPLTEYLDHVRDPNGLYSSSKLHEGFIEYASGEHVSLNPSENANLVDGVEISIHK
eukprot:gene14879-17068_t